MQGNDILSSQPAWLDEAELAGIRSKMPLIYVEAVPVRIDHLGRVERVGLLLTPQADGRLARAIVSGRVLYGERVRDALWRHLSKDLGPDSDPQIPADPSPFTVVEYFPDDRSGFTDPRQHAVSLVFLVPISGEVAPSESSLAFSWLTVEEACSITIASEMSGGQDRIIRMAMAHAGVLP
ncbi:DUF4916 domain-containing protein [Stomatohabitans albus]|uniref:DUF4916 domain-containing protein n=1 Tax=Stomatohabitans albus TaxID=3110766 RepID=UPI00300C7D40